MQSSTWSAYCDKSVACNKCSTQFFFSMNPFSSNIIP